MHVFGQWQNIGLGLTRSWTQNISCFEATALTAHPQRGHQNNQIEANAAQCLLNVDTVSLSGLQPLIKCGIPSYRICQEWLKSCTHCSYPSYPSQCAQVISMTFFDISVLTWLEKVFIFLFCFLCVYFWSVCYYYSASFVCPQHFVMKIVLFSLLVDFFMH